MLEVGGDELHAVLPGEIGDAGELHVDGDHTMAAPAEVSRVPPAAAGEIEHRTAARDQGREADDPGRGRRGLEFRHGWGRCNNILFRHKKSPIL